MKGYLVDIQPSSVLFIFHVLKGKPDFYKDCAFDQFLSPTRSAGEHVWKRGLQWPNLHSQKLLCMTPLKKMSPRDERLLVFCSTFSFYLVAENHRTFLLYCSTLAYKNHDFTSAVLLCRNYFLIGSWYWCVAGEGAISFSNFVYTAYWNVLEVTKPGIIQCSLNPQINFYMICLLMNSN